jgi:hypothetical protein
MPPGGDIIWGYVKVKEAPIRHNPFCPFLVPARELNWDYVGFSLGLCEFYVKNLKRCQYAHKNRG